MNGRERYTLIKSALRLLVAEGRSGAYVVFVDADRPDEYVQTAWTGDHLIAEVGSREWHDPVRPLTPDARAALETLEFTGGGPERNYVRPTLPSTARGAAAVLSRAFEVAYGHRGASIVPSTNSDAVAAWMQKNDLGAPVSPPPPPEPLTADMVRRALEARGWRVFLDEQTGMLMTYWGWDRELGQSVHVYYEVAGGGPCRVLSITAIGGAPIFDVEHAKVLQWVNQWNDTHRWPCVALATEAGEEFSWIHCRWSLPAGAAITQTLVQDSVDVVTDGSLEFFRWLCAQRTGKMEPASSL